MKKFNSNFENIFDVTSLKDENKVIRAEEIIPNDILSSFKCNSLCRVLSFNFISTWQDVFYCCLRLKLLKTSFQIIFSRLFIFEARWLERCYYEVFNQIWMFYWFFEIDFLALFSLIAEQVEKKKATNNLLEKLRH